MPSRRITGLQRQIYSLYKRSLQMVATKPLETRSSWFAFVAHQFRAPHLGGALRKKDVAAIEHLLRRGDKQLETFSASSVKSVAVPDEAWEWKQGWVASGGKEGRKG
ncbi:hypothetical protein JCM11641_002627 [Rhodosporidiobolus odoratus]